MYCITSLICCFYVHSDAILLSFLFRFIVQIKENNHMFVCLFVFFSSSLLLFFHFHFHCSHGNFCVPKHKHSEDRDEKEIESVDKKRKFQVCVLNSTDATRTNKCYSFSFRFVSFEIVIAKLFAMSSPN